MSVIDNSTGIPWESQFSHILSRTKQNLNRINQRYSSSAAANTFSTGTDEGISNNLTSNFLSSNPMPTHNDFLNQLGTAGNNKNGITHTSFPVKSSASDSNKVIPPQPESSINKSDMEESIFRRISNSFGKVVEDDKKQIHELRQETSELKQELRFNKS